MTRHNGDDRKAMSTYELWLFHESQKAWQVGREKTDRDNERCFWLPKSQCRLLNELADRKRGIWIKVQIPLWLAEEKGLCPHRDADERGADVDLMEDPMGDGPMGEDPMGDDPFPGGYDTDERDYD